MIKHLPILLFLLASFKTFAQVDTSIPKKKSTPDSNVVKKPAVARAPVKASDSLSKSRAAVIKVQAAKRDSLTTGNSKPVIKIAAPTVKTDSLGKAIPKSLRRDSLGRLVTDSSRPAKDSLHKAAAVKKAVPANRGKILTWQEDTLFARIFKVPYLPIHTQPVWMISNQRVPETKDELFYLLAGIILFLAFVKVSFPKYFHDLFRLFFQASMRQNQAREALSQDNLPSLMLNFLFILSGGLFIALVAVKYHWRVNIPFWWLFLYCTALLAAIYLVKFFFIRFSGWVFNAGEEAGTYIFIVFLINKIIGVAIIPLLLLFAFLKGDVVDVIGTICGSMVVLLLLYRYVLSLSIIRRNLKVSPLHFFIYLCTIELIPILVMYKVLFNYISTTI